MLVNQQVGKDAVDHRVLLVTEPLCIESNLYLSFMSDVRIWVFLVKEESSITLSATAESRTAGVPSAVPP